MKLKSELIKSRYLNRRQFLIGAGKTLLFLPPLASLLPREVFAEMIGTKTRIVTAIGVYGVNPKPRYPEDTIPMNQFMGADHTYYKKLSEMGKKISHMIDFNNPALAGLEAKMNLIRGLDIVAGTYVNGGHNFSILSGTLKGQYEPVYGASIDTIIENELGVRAIRMKTDPRNKKADGFSFYRRSPGGARQVSSLITGDEALFNKLFPSGSNSEPTDSGPTRDMLIVDKVLKDLNQLKNNKRISSSDLIKLEEYITSVHEVQKRMIANRMPASEQVTCNETSLDFQVSGGSSSVKSYEKLYENYGDLITLAMQCDRARIAHIANTASSDVDGNGNSFHHDGAPNENAQADKQMWFLHRIARLAQKLDAVQDPFDSDGKTLLDNSLVLWTNQLGSWSTSHSMCQIPAITFGSGGGNLRTGYFVDYRKRPFLTAKGWDHHTMGRPYKQLLISIMEAAGLSSNQYLKYGDGNGFGEWQPYWEKAKDPARTHHQMFNSEHNKPLPFLSMGV